MRQETFDAHMIEQAKPPRRKAATSRAQSADIVVHTDFTRESIEAANAATALARRSHNNLWLIHNISDALEALPKRASDAALSRIREMLENEADRMRQRGVEVQTALLGGNSENRLPNVIGDCRIGLVVVSKPALLAQWLMGAAAKNDSANIRVPVLQIQDAAPFETWGEAERPLRIVVGVDFQAASDAALRWVAGLAEKGPCDVIAAHIKTVLPEDQPPSGKNPAGAENFRSHQSFQDRSLDGKVRSILGGAARRVQAVEHYTWGSVGSLLIHIARENQSDLLVIGNRQEDISDSVHSSVSQVILRRATMNVASVPLPPERVQIAPTRVEPARNAIPAVTSAVNLENL